MVADALSAVMGDMVKKSRGVLNAKPYDKGKTAKSGSRPYFDDEKGYYIAIPDHHISKKFVIKQVVGQGTFGRVVHCYDTYTNQECAVKVIRSIDKYRRAAETEMEILQYIHSVDEDNECGCVYMNDAIDFRNHICISFPLLGHSVYKVIQMRGYKGFSLSQTLDMTHQLLSSTEFLHSIRLIHTDLKPENILLKPNAIEKGEDGEVHITDFNLILIDFSSAHWSDNRNQKEISTRHYRAPEVLLELEWSFPCDIWSLGCIMFELLTGTVLFQTHDNTEHLAMIERIVDKYRLHYVEHSRKAGWFKVNKSEANPQFAKLRWPDLAPEKSMVQYVKKFCEPLAFLVRPFLKLPEGEHEIYGGISPAAYYKKDAAKESKKTYEKEHDRVEKDDFLTEERSLQFLALLTDMLKLRPHYRPTAATILDNPLFHLKDMKYTRRENGVFSNSKERQKWMKKHGRIAKVVHYDTRTKKV